MKKLGLLFIIGFSSLAWGQTYNLELDIEMGKTPGGHSTSFYGLVEYVLTDGTKGHFTFIDGTYGTIKKNITLSKPIREMHLYSRRYRARKKICGGNRTWFVRDKNLPCADLKNEFYTAYTNSCLVHNSKMTVKAFKITPNLELPWPGAGNNFTEDKVLTLTAPGGFPSFVYTWEYSSNNGATFQPIPRVIQKRNRVHILGSHFLDKSDHGKTIYFRINYGCDHSKAINYRYFVSAPRFLKRTPNLTTCYYTNDGSVKIYLDRALKPGEQLSITSTNSDFPSSDYVNLITSHFDKNNAMVLKGLKSGKYTIQVFGFYNGFSTYVEDTTHKTSFTIKKQVPVEFTTKFTKVRCFGGSDGTITITGTGGTGPYKYQINGSASKAFSKGNTHIISGLSKGSYTIKVQDSNDCIAQIIRRDTNGNIIGSQGELIKTIVLDEESDSPVSIKFPNDGYKEPTAFGFSNGRITAEIKGGKPLSNGKYNYTWTHENGTKWSSFSDTLNSDAWYLILENAIAGTYRLTVTDANYTKATDKTGCTIVDAEFTLNGPPLLRLSFAETNLISCNKGNTSGNLSSDGELTVTATGGVPFNPLIDGHAYKYTWKKKDASGVYRTIIRKNSNVLSNIDTGDYAVNIEDANGIIIGTYRNNALVTAADQLYTLNQPELIQITFTKVDVFCNGGNDGSIDATITGGTGNYTVNWNTGATTEDIDTLVTGTYTIDVTDEKGCQAQASIAIDEPDNPLNINYTFFAPTFAGATNGWIEATVTGGTPLGTGAYTYVWKDANGRNLNAQVTETINANSFLVKLNNLEKGVYNLTIEDKNHPLAINKNNCTIINSPIELFEPDPLKANIQLHTPISCHSTNTYGNPFSDGAIEVIAEGGVHLQPSDNNGLKYYYTWKKEVSPNVWTVLTNQTSNIATNLDAGNYAVNIKDANGIILGVYQNNVLVNPTDVTYNFEEPPLLALTFEKQDAYCHNGSDGWAKTIITGGTSPYHILWSNGDTTEQTSNLSKGLYDVSITDSRGCQVSESIRINQPTEPLNINYTAFSTPSTAGASDGWIEAQISGGTNFSNGSYTYYWQDDSGAILNTQSTTSVVNNVFQIQLNNIPKGSYHLTIEDANFPLATTKDGCTFLDDEFILYDPIEATISIQTPISCHQDNLFNNPFSDGALQVVITGGLPFATGLPYSYYWKKENTSSGFNDLNQNSDIATGLSHGNYALNVEDSRGVVIGVYKSLNLINATDALFLFEEPDLLEVSLTKTEISCDAGNDATAIAHITGGTLPYDIQWSNGQNTASATNLIAGNHVVYVTDARGCQITGNIFIDQPGELMINVLEETHPTCFQGGDGKIELEPSGGASPYKYSWNTGATTTNINNLPQGTYTFSLTDANGCKAFKEIVLEHPNEINIDLGEDRTLCKDQTHTLDGSIADANATYIWTSNNGFSATKAQISVTEAGVYEVTATSQLGCTATETIVILYNDTQIDAEFLLSSQAYVNQDVILFNVSSPLGETSEWVLPENVTTIAQTKTSITLRFPEVNTYQIGFISTQGNCYQEVYKNIVVEEDSGLASPGDTASLFIEKFILTPNPNTGQFKLHIDLAESSPISIRIFTIQGSFIFAQPNLPPAEKYTIPMSLTLPSGMYFVVLETAKQTQLKQMVIN